LLSETVARRQPHPAKVHLFLAGRTMAEFSAYHGCSANWTYQVLNGRASAPESFRHDMAIFLGLPEEMLFPERYGVAR
jgi:hypothetical protein